MDLKKLTEPLSVDEIEFRVQSINNGGYATVLAYKDARVDQNRLDKVCGPMNWQRSHTRDNANCVVSIWDDKKGQWISKEDTGTASNTEAEKGLASDSFKRACFNWGIGRELYDYPLISIKLHADEMTDYVGKKRQSYKLRLRDWKWASLFNGNKIVALQAVDQTGTTRFQWKSDDNEQFMATLANFKQMYRQRDSEGLVMADQGMQQDEQLYDAVWGALKPKERNEIKALIAEELKAQKEEG